MSNLVRAIVLGAVLAATSLAGATAVAQARPEDRPAIGQDVRPAGTPEQATADAALRRVLARERSSVPDLAPAKAGVPAPALFGARPGRLAGPLLVLVAALALLAVLASRRGRRRVRTEQTA
jgi:hypothetical protein